jgi:thymidylate kinase
MKETIVILDGVDKTGKDTLQKELIKIANGKIMPINRGFVSQIAYSRIYNRGIDEDYFFKKANAFYKLGVKLIILTASENELIKRFDIHGEKDLLKSDIKKHLNVFDSVVNDLITKAAVEVLLIDTTKKDINETVTEILNFIGEK